jgi:dUTP pyrophosphatase
LCTEKFIKTMKVRIVNTSHHPCPAYETVFSAGMDLRAFIKNNLILEPMDREVVPTGLFIELPEGYEAQVRPRSGMAFKFGVTVLNTPGTIDADYRGEVKVLLVNLSKETFVVEDGMRIAQMIISQHENVEWEEVDSLNHSERGIGGYGHTGVK